MAMRYREDDMDILNLFSNVLRALGIDCRPVIFKMSHMVVKGNFIGEDFKFIGKVEDDE